jgi:long-subunit fatty acid transport protein
LDAAGAGYWNPATIRLLGHREAYIGMELIHAELTLSSSVPAGLFGSFPTEDRAGSTDSNGGLAVIPTIAWVAGTDERPVTFGVGVYATVGGSVNFKGDASNPILSPHNPPPALGGTGEAPFTLGFGPQNGTAQILAIAPNIAFDVGDRLTVGFGPTIYLALFTMDPAFFGPRNENGTFPPASGTRPVWGAGFQTGFVYQTDIGLNLGASYKSKGRFETFPFNSKDEIGRSQELELELEIPQIISVGIAYEGLESARFALDVRHLAYGSAALFGDPVIEGGVGWESIMAIAFGAQFDLGRDFTVQAGYLYNENPIPEVATLFNTQLPAMQQHQISGGFSRRLNDAITLDTGFFYSPKATLEGSLIQLPGAGVKLEQSLFSVLFGTRIRI